MPDNNNEPNGNKLRYKNHRMQQTDIRFSIHEYIIVGKHRNQNI